MSFSKLYCRDAGAVILVYDANDSESFGGMQKWYEIMSADILPANALLFVVGNKSDLIEQANFFENDVKAWADRINADYFRVSAKSGQGIDNLFIEIAKKILLLTKKDIRTSFILPKITQKVASKKRRLC